MNKNDDPGAPYSVAVNVAVRFIRSKAAGAAPIQITSDPKAPAVRITEEQIHERYPWGYAELTERCRKRYPGFKVTNQYHKVRKQLELDKSLAHVRLLDPKNPKGQKKTFYSPGIMTELDKFYKRKLMLVRV